MAGPLNVPLGNNEPTMEAPRTEVPEQDLTRERNMAKFSKSEEFKALKGSIEGRITFWQGYVPGGNGQPISVKDLQNEERGWRWLAADSIIAELRSILSAYEQAAEAVKDAAQRE